MKYITTLLLPLLFLTSYSQENKHLLIFGGGQFAIRDTTNMLQRMLDETNEKIEVETCVTGGTLTDLITSVHDENGYTMTRLPEGRQTEAVQKLLSRKWDYVIITEDLISTLIPRMREISSGPAIMWVDSIVKASGGATILYQCYPNIMFADGRSIEFTKNYTELKFFDRTQQAAFDSTLEKSDLLNRETQVAPGVFVSDSVAKSAPVPGYSGQVLESKFFLDQMAKKTGAKVLPIGYVMELCRIKYPDLSLYQGPAPSKAGKYLIACTTYKFLTGKNPKNLVYNPSLPVKDVKLIRDLVGEVPF